jgi:hypothetical protein
MDGDRSARVRTVVRACEGHRLERELLALIYEQLWPVTRVRIPRRQAPLPSRRQRPGQSRAALGG